MLVCLLSMMYLSSYPETTFLDLSSSSSPGCPSCTCHQGASSNRSSSSGRFQIGIFSTSPATERRHSGTGSFCWVRGRHICYCLTFGLLIYTNEWKVFNVGTSGKIMKNSRHKLQKGGNSHLSTSATGPKDIGCFIQTRFKTWIQPNCNRSSPTRALPVFYSLALCPPGITYQTRWLIIWLSNELMPSRSWGYHCANKTVASTQFTHVPFYTV